MATSTMRPERVVFDAEVTLPEGFARSAFNLEFTGAQNYKWLVLQYPPNGGSAYANVFVEYAFSLTNTVVCAVNRALRNDTTGSITVRLLCVGF